MSDEIIGMVLLGLPLGVATIVAAFWLKSVASRACLGCRWSRKQPRGSLYCLRPCRSSKEGGLVYVEGDHCCDLWADADKPLPETCINCAAFVPSYVSSFKKGVCDVLEEDKHGSDSCSQWRELG